MESAAKLRETKVDSPRNNYHNLKAQPSISCCWNLVRFKTNFEISFLILFIASCITFPGPDRSKQKVSGQADMIKGQQEERNTAQRLRARMTKHLSMSGNSQKSVIGRISPHLFPLNILTSPPYCRSQNARGPDLDHPTQNPFSILDSSPHYRSSPPFRHHVHPFQSD